MNKNLKRIPYGIIDYKEIVDGNYYYVDKTKYLEKIENDSKVLMYLRPGRFGKSLFTSVLSYYYDINYKEEFEHLFKDKYIYKHPTKGKNSYYILRLDFSGIRILDDDYSRMEKSFNVKVIGSISDFIDKYKLPITMDYTLGASEILYNFLIAFKRLYLDNKIYIIIDEYDNFTNAILNGDGKDFTNVVGNDGFVKLFYAVIKEFCGLSVVEKVFITGICPITMDTMTTGFNICKYISKSPIYNSMVGLTHTEVKELLNSIDKAKSDYLFEIIKENYNGYLFNEDKEERVFNATLVMYFLSNYIELNKVPRNLVDSYTYIYYSKIKDIITFKNNKYYNDIIKEIYDDNIINAQIKDRFDLNEDMTYSDIVSLLYYFGYLTFNGNNSFIVPNRVIEEAYGNYFKLLLKERKVDINDKIKIDIINNIISTGDVTLLTNYVSSLLKEDCNRVLTKFDERYIQLMYYMILIGSSNIYTYLEREVGGGYTDVYITPSSNNDGYKVLIEIRYISKKDYNRRLAEKKLNDAKFQIIRYIEEKIKDKNKLRCYSIIFVGNEPKLVKELKI